MAIWNLSSTSSRDEERTVSGWEERLFQTSPKANSRQYQDVKRTDKQVLQTYSWSLKICISLIPKIVHIQEIWLYRTEENTKNSNALSSSIENWIHFQNIIL